MFILQGLLIWIVSAPISIMQALPSDLGSATIFGFCIWLLGFVFEALADLQLARFKSNPNNKGQLLTSGLWSLSRHPNYFGDATQWWGFWHSALSPDIWWTIFSPVLMTFSLLKFSGVPITAKMPRRDKLGYQNYVKTVPQFIPSFSCIIRSNK